VRGGRSIVVAAGSPEGAATAEQTEGLRVVWYGARGE